MGFIPQFKDDKINIDYSRCTAVNVIAVFNQERKIKPLFFSIENEYDDLCKVEITGIKYTKECKGCLSYCCTYKVGSVQRECILTYYLIEHLWVLEH